MQRLPDVECDHCVLRARYNAHKPGETTFLQCADIRISKSAKKSSQMLDLTDTHARSDKNKLVPLKRALALKEAYARKYKFDTLKVDNTPLYGIAYNPFEPHRSHYVSVDTMTGSTQMVRSFPFGIDDPVGGNDANFLLDEIVAIDNYRNTSTFLMHAHGDRETAAGTLYKVGSTNGSLVTVEDLFKFDGDAINGVSWYTDSTSAAFRIIPVAGQEGNTG